MLASRIAPLVASMLLLVAAAACSGGSQDAASGAPPALPILTLTSRADAICRTAGHSQALTFKNAKTAAERQAAWGKAKHTFLNAVSDLRGLQPSPGVAREYNAYLDALVRAAPFYDRLAEAVKGGSQDEQLRVLGESFIQTAHADDLGAALGLHDCALDYDTADPPQTKADYVDTVDTVCLDVGAAASTLPAATTIEQLADTMGRLVEPLRAFTRDLQSIPPPPGDEATLRPWIDAQLDGAAQLIRMHTAAVAGDVAAIQRASRRAVADQRRADKVALAYGIDGCTDTSYLKSA